MEEKKEVLSLPQRWFKDAAESFAPETDKLIVLGIIVYLCYTAYLGKTDQSLTNTAIGGLLGYLGKGMLERKA